MPDWIAIGKILKAWGIRGQAKCSSYNPDSDLFRHFDEVFLQSSGQFSPLKIEQAKFHQGFWLLSFAGISTPESLQDFRGKEMWVPRSQLPALEAGEIYLVDLEGMQVLAPEGKVLGVVQGFRRSGDTELLLIGDSAATTAPVPYREEFVQETSLERGEIRLTDLGMEVFTVNDHDQEI